MDKFKIESERLILRDIDPRDVRDFHNICTDYKITKYLTYVKTKNLIETEKWVNQKIDWNNEKPRKSFNLSILLKDSNEFIGWIGIGETEDGKLNTMDFGYAILPNFQGKGYASEALKCLIDYCFKNLDVTKILGDCDKNNIASRKVMERVGMKFEKEKNGKVFLSISKVNPKLELD